MKVKLKDLQAERKALWAQFKGGRGVDLAEDIDHLDKRIRRLKIRRAERLAREVARCEGVGFDETCDQCRDKMRRIVEILDGL